MMMMMVMIICIVDNVSLCNNSCILIIIANFFFLMSDTMLNISDAWVDCEMATIIATPWIVPSHIHSGMRQVPHFDK